MAVKQGLSFTVLRDTSEQKGLLFPKGIVLHRMNNGLWTTPYSDTTDLVRITTEDRCLRPWGCDYTLLGYEHIVRIERKFTIGELSTNFITDDRARQNDSLTRLCGGCAFPILLLDMLGSELWALNRTTLSTPHVVDRMLQTCRRMGIEVLLAGSRKSTIGTRRKQGEFLVRLMIHTVLSQETK